MNTRIRFLDFARGISVLFVVIGHMLPMNEGFGQWIYSFHIPVFFIISGILFYKNNNKALSNKAFIKKVLRSILYPYISISIINILFNTVIMLINKNFEIKSVLHDIIATLDFNGILALWFLPTLLFAECFLFFLLKMSKGRVYILLIIFIILFLLILYITMNNLQDCSKVIRFLLVFVSRIAIASIFLFVGYLTGVHSFRKSVNRIILFTIGFFAFVLSLILYRYNIVDLHYAIIGNPILYFINAICGSAGVIVFSYFVYDYSNFVQFLGKNSIVLFSTHLNFCLLSLSNRICLIVFNDNNILIQFIILIIIETILIQTINKFVPFIIKFSALEASLNKCLRNKE